MKTKHKVSTYNRKENTVRGHRTFWTCSIDFAFNEVAGLLLPYSARLLGGLQSEGASRRISYQVRSSETLYIANEVLIFSHSDPTRSIIEGT